jgi:hypothetical protein
MFHAEVCILHSRAGFMRSIQALASSSATLSASVLVGSGWMDLKKHVVAVPLAVSQVTAALGTYFNKSVSRRLEYEMVQLLYDTTCSVSLLFSVGGPPGTKS